MQYAHSDAEEDVDMSGGSEGGVKSLFLLLDVMEASWPRLVVLAGIFLEMAQLFALLFNPTFFWSRIVQSVSDVVYSVLLPFWDPHFVTFADYSTSTVCSGVLFASLLLLYLMLVYCYYNVARRLETKLTFIARFPLYLMVGPLFLPSMHLLLAVTICIKRDEGSATSVLARYPDHTCLSESSMWLMLFLLCIPAFAMLIFSKAVVTLSMHDDYPWSNAIRCRTHSIVEGSLLLFEIASAVLYHYLPSVDQSTTFTGLLAAASLAMALLHVFFLPFKYQFVNRIRVTGFGVLFYCAVVQSVYQGVGFTASEGSLTSHGDLIAILCGGPIIGLLSYTLADCRISGSFLRDVEKAKQGLIRQGTYRRPFPWYLPKEERIDVTDDAALARAFAYASVNDFLPPDSRKCASTVDGADTDSVGRTPWEDFVASSGPAHMAAFDDFCLSSYIKSVYVSTDIELATRSVPLFTYATHSSPSEPSIDFALRIYVKGITRFQRNEWVTMQFANFLTAFVPGRALLALTICEGVRRNCHLSWAKSYRIHRCIRVMRADKLINRMKSRQNLAAALSLHKETLLGVTHFWTRLLCGQADLNQLCRTASALICNGNNGLRRYYRAITENTNRHTLTGYARFLDQVILDREFAQKVRLISIDVVEKQSMGMPINEAAMLQRCQHRSLGCTNGKLSTSLQRFLYIILTFVLMVLLGFCALIIAFFSDAQQTLNHIAHAGSCRIYASRLSLLAMIAANTSDTNTIWHDLRDSLDLLRLSNNNITFRASRRVYGDVVAAMKKPLVPFFYKNAIVEPMGAWRAGEAFISAMETLVLSSSSAGSVQAALDVILEEKANGVTVGYTEALTAFIRQLQFEVKLSQCIALLLYCLVVVLLIGVFLALKYYIVRINRMLIAELSLLRLIPRASLTEMIQTMNNRVDSLGSPDEEFERMLAARGMQEGLSDEEALSVRESDPSDTSALPRGGLLSPAHGPDEQKLNNSINNDEDVSEDAFAHLSHISNVADVGRLRLHHGQYETPYQSDEHIPPLLTPEEARQRQRKIDSVDVAECLLRVKQKGGEGVSASSAEESHGAEWIRSGSDRTSLRCRRGLAFITLLCFVLSIAVGGATVVTISRVSSPTLTSMSDLGFWRDSLLTVSRAFDAAEGVAYYPKPFSMQVLEEQMKKMLSNSHRINDMVHSRVSPPLAEDYSSYLKTYTCVWNQVIAAAALSCSGNEELDCSALSSVTWTPETFIPSPLEAAFFEEGDDLPQDKETDMARPPTERMQLAHNVVSSAYYTSKKDAMHALLQAVRNQAVASHEEAAAAQLAASQVAKKIVLGCAVAITVLVVLQLLVARVMLTSRGAISVVILLFLCFAVALLIISSFTFALSDPQDGTYKSVASVYNMLEEVHSVFYRLKEDVKLASFAGVELGAVNFLTSGLESLAEAWVSLFSSMDSQYFSQLSDAFSSLEYCRILNAIAAALGCKYNGYNQDICSQSPMGDLDWDIANETHGYRTRLEFEGTEQLLYTNRNEDLNQLAAEKQRLLALSLVFGPLQARYYESGWLAATAVMEEYADSQRTLGDSRLQVYQPLIFATLFLSVAMAVFSVLICVMLAFVSVEGQRAQMALRSSLDRVIRRDAVSDESGKSSRLGKRAIFALAAFASLMTVSFAVHTVDIQKNMPLVEYLDILSEWCEGAMLSGRFLMYAYVSSSFHPLALRLSTSTIDSAERFYRAFHMQLGESALELLFGKRDISFLRYDKEIARTPSIVGMQEESPVLAFGGLVDPSHRRWNRRVLELIDAHGLTSLQQEAVMLDDLMKLSEKTVASANAIYDALLSTRKTWFLIGLATLCVALAVFFIMAWYFLVSVVRRLAREELGTQLLLYMIPPHIRNSVPAIRQYMTVGATLWDDNHDELSDIAVDLNVEPTIVIDVHGIILSFSHAAEETFLWSKFEAIGQNVALLMPEKIALEHDAYIATYCQTGVKNVIDTQRAIRAKRKDGTCFSAYLCVQEIRTKQSLVFIGVIRLSGEGLALEHSAKLSVALADAFPIPIVVTDTRGVLVQYSRMAEVVYKFPHDEAIGRKIQLLMPRAEAEKQDHNLAQFIRTGRAYLVNATHTVRCKRMNGEIFPCQLSVRCAVRGGSQHFIAYVEDLTSHVHLETVAAASTATLRLFPVPLVITDGFGNVLLASDSACSTLGYSQQELKGRTASTLLEEPLGAILEQYVSNYVRRGDDPLLRSQIHYGSARRRGDSRGSNSFPVRVILNGFTPTTLGPHVLVFIEDMSRKQTLKTRSKVSDAILSLSSIPVILTTDNGLILQLSVAAETMFHVKAGDAYGRSIGSFFAVRGGEYPRRSTNEDEDTQLELVPTEASVLFIDNPIDRIIQEYKVSGRMPNLDRYMTGVAVTADKGRVFDVSVLVKEIVQADGRMFLIFMRDTSVDLRLLEATRWNDVLMSMSATPLVCSTVDGEIFACSDAACTHFYWPREELVARSVAMLMPARYASRYRQFVSAYRHRGASGSTEEANLVMSLLNKEVPWMGCTRDNEEFPVSMFIHEIAMDGADPFMVVHLCNALPETQGSTQKLIHQTLYEMSPVPLIGISSQGLVMTFSRSAEECFGYDADEVVGRNVKILMPADIASIHDGYLRSYEKTKEKHMIDGVNVTTARRKDGTTFLVELSVRELDGKDSMAFVAYLRDISVKKQLKHTVVTTEMMAELDAVTMLEVGFDGTVHHCNKHAEKQFGFVTGELAGGSIYDMVQEHTRRSGGSDQPQWLNEMLLEAQSNRGCTSDRADAPLPDDVELTASATASGRAFTSAKRQLMARRKDGMLFKCELSLAVVADEDGQLQDGANVSAAAAGERQRYSRAVVYIRSLATELHLQYQTAVSEGILALSPDPIVGCSSAGVITVFNRAAEESFGYTADEAMGQSIRLLTSPDDAAQYEMYLRRYIETGVKTILDAPPRLVVARRKDGRTFQVRLAVREIKDAEKAPSFIAYLGDASVDTAVQSEAALADEMTGGLPIAVIITSHEGVIEQFSSAAEKLLLYDQLDVVGRSISLLRGYSAALEARDLSVASQTARQETNVAESARSFKADFFSANMTYQDDKPAEGIDEHVIITRSNGSTFRANVCIHALHSPDQKKPRYVAFIENVEGMATTQAAVDEERRLVMSCPAAVLVVNCRSVVVESNVAAQTMFAVTPPEMVGRQLASIGGEGHLSVPAFEKMEGIICAALEGMKKLDDAESDSSAALHMLETQYNEVTCVRQGGERRKIKVSYALVRPCKPTEEPRIVLCLCDATEGLGMQECLERETLLVRSTAVALMELDPDGHLRYASDSLLATLGYSLDEVLSTRYTAFVTKGDRMLASFFERVQMAVGTAEGVPVPRNGVLHFVARDGSIRWMEGEARCLVRKDGSVESILVFARLPSGTHPHIGDMSMSAMSTTSEAMAIMWTDGTILRVNDAFLHLFHVPSSLGVAGMNVERFMPQATAEAFRKHIRPFALAGDSTRLEKPVILPMKASVEKAEVSATLPMELTVSGVGALEECNGESQGRVLLLRVRLVAEEQRLLLSKRVSDAVVDICDAAIIVIDGMGTIHFFSREAEERSGIPARLAVGLDALDVLLTPSDADVINQRLVEAQRTGRRDLLSTPRQVTIKQYAVPPTASNLGSPVGALSAELVVHELVHVLIQPQHLFAVYLTHW